MDAEARVSIPPLRALRASVVNPLLSTKVHIVEVPALILASDLVCVHQRASAVGS